MTKGALVGALAIVLSALPADAQDGGFGAGGFFSSSEDRAGYSMSLTPARAGAPRMLRHEADGSFIVKRSGSDAWSVSAHAGELELSASPVVPGTGLTIPSKLWSVQAGGAFARRIGERRRWGASLGLGSASDEPFNSIRETEVKAMAYREFPSRERNSWLLFLAYSNNRSFLNNIPFPGVAYVVREPVPGLHATVGLPFILLSYQPGKNWRLALSAFGPTNISAEGARRLGSSAWAYARFERNPSQWLRAGRENLSDRLIFDRQGPRLGVRSPLGGGVSADLSAGLDFRRRFYESKDANRSGVPKAELPNAWIGLLRLSWRR
ncbi:MAG: hypothetical protein IPN65_05845 [Elusimicrobia bacterium]|nr:hypothetical protein [Elusimicrobiota bacterium]